MESIDEGNPESGEHSSSMIRISCDPVMMPSELSDFDRPLGAPRPANENDNQVNYLVIFMHILQIIPFWCCLIEFIFQNVTFESSSYAKTEDTSACGEYSVKQLPSFNE